MFKYLITRKEEFDRWGEPCVYRLAMEQVRKTQPAAVRGRRLRATGGTEYAWVYRNADERRVGDQASIAHSEDLRAPTDDKGDTLPIAILAWTNEA
jgi:hypothetical protein